MLFSSVSGETHSSEPSNQHPVPRFGPGPSSKRVHINVYVYIYRESRMCRDDIGIYTRLGYRDTRKERTTAHVDPVPCTW